MPLYEYRCDGCGDEFEALVRSPSESPRCPNCDSEALSKRFSVPASARVVGASTGSLPVCDTPAPSGGCGANGCGGGFCAMDN